MNRFAAILFVILFSVTSANAEFNCGGYTGTCKKPKGEGSSGNSCIHEDPLLKSKVIYCPYFQCDSKGNILMSDSAKMFDPPNIIGGIRNIGVVRSNNYSCWANCCYGNGGKFLGEFNQDAGCRNKCCDTVDEYLSGSCSSTKPKPKPTTKPQLTPLPTPPGSPTGVPQPEPTPPDDIIDSPLPDEEITFGGGF